MHINAFRSEGHLTSVKLSFSETVCSRSTDWTRGTWDSTRSFAGLCQAPAHVLWLLSRHSMLNIHHTPIQITGSQCSPNAACSACCMTTCSSLQMWPHCGRVWATGKRDLCPMQMREGHRAGRGNAQACPLYYSQQGALQGLCETTASPTFKPAVGTCQWPPPAPLPLQALLLH